ncbi:hypothetical protein [Rhizobium rhizogenes]|uniref:hypothetical protein n=1 Tax=Rhizobium rhizogenes TaxID=359 RepID=UPI0022C48C44|nr:hypothetical protein [Rhizobium rhizogenes]MCZ7466651.1 hypothetical protein [Rhizobium rhizogenes]
MADIHARLEAREELEASFESLKAQGIQASLDYIQVNVAPQIASLQQSITLAQEQIDQIIIGGKAPDTLKFGGQLPAYYATAQALADGLSGKVPATRKINGKELSADFDLAKNDIGLGSVNNTADADKPVSTSQQQALDAKVDGPKLLPAPGLLGRASDGEGVAEALTLTQARKLLGGWEPIGDPLNLAGFISVDWINLSPFVMLKLEGSAQANAGSTSPGFYMAVSENNGATFIVGGSTYAASRVGAEGDAIGAAGLLNLGYFPITFDALAAGSFVGFTYTWSTWNKAGKHTTVSGEADFTKSNNVRRWEKNFGYRTDNANARNALRLGSRDNFAFANGRAQLFGIRG